MSGDGTTQVGKISKQWSGFMREAFTDADMFGISFPMDLDVKIKAVLLGAVFLIVGYLHVVQLKFILMIFQDYMFFEKKGRQESDGFGMLS